MAEDTLAKVKKAASVPEPEPEPDKLAVEPVDAQPKATQLLSVSGTVFSVGRGSVSFRAPDPAVFETPDAAIVITGLTTNMLRQFTVGQVYTIVVSTTP